MTKQRKTNEILKISDKDSQLNRTTAKKLFVELFIKFYLLE